MKLPRAIEAHTALHSGGYGEARHVIEVEALQGCLLTDVRDEMGRHGLAVDAAHRRVLPRMIGGGKRKREEKEG